MESEENDIYVGFSIIFHFYSPIKIIKFLVLKDRQSTNWGFAMHHFISHSSVDAVVLTKKIIDRFEINLPPIPFWIDDRDARPIGDWDQQIDDAIRTCESLIFLMTSDSVKHTSFCKNEWVQALKYKKPIVPVQLHQNAELPIRLNSCHYIDFTQDFEVGFQKLISHLDWMQTPAGELQHLNSRLADAQKDLSRANDTNRTRIEKEINELTIEIERLKAIIKNPEIAAEKTNQSILARMAIERQPTIEIERKIHSKFINPPPMLAPSYFQDRFVETGIISDFLMNDSLRMITIIGRGGIGKTAMVCRLLKSLEKGLLPDDHGKLDVNGIVYLTQIGKHQISFQNLYEDLCKLLPPEAAENFHRIYKDGKRSVQSKMLQLLEAFQDNPVIVLLDNFETFIDIKTGSLILEDLEDALNVLLEAPHHSVKVIVTTRTPPQDQLLIRPERQRIMALDEGLNSPYAENILREMDSDGALGLKNAPESILQKIRENTRGFPRALEAFYAVLASDRSTTLEELLSKIENTLPEYVVEKLVGEAFSRLDKNAQLVIQALAIFGRPVSSVAVDFLLQPYIQTIDSARILNLLVNMHFLRRELGKYYLHPIDLAYAISLIPVRLNNEQGSVGELFTKDALRRRASEYYHQIRRPRDEWRKLSDLEPQLAEFDLRCAAGDFETAFEIVNEIDWEYLCLWGHAGLVVEMRGKLVGELTDNVLVCRNLFYLGRAYSVLGYSRKAIDYCEQSLQISRDKNIPRQLESNNLNTLAIAWRRIGQISKSIEMYQNCLNIYQKEFGIPDAVVLSNLGVAYRYLGLISKSIECHDKALSYLSQKGDPRNLGITLGIQAVNFRYLGQQQKAIEYGEKASEIARMVNDRHWEAYHLAELGSSYFDLGDLSKGLNLINMATNIAHETADSQFEGVWTVRISIMELLSNDSDNALAKLKYAEKLTKGIDNAQYNVEYGLAKAMIELHDGRLEEAHESIRLRLQTEYRIFLPDILVTNGIIFLRQKRYKEAAEQFLATINLADNLIKQSSQFYSAIEAKGAAFYGLALCQKVEGSKNLSSAIECYRTARSIVSAPGVIRRALFFFDECAKADENNIIIDVRNAVEGKE